MNAKFIPFHRPSVGLEELTAVQQVLESRWLTTGPVSQRFEHEFAEYVGAKHALALNSGTAALQLAANLVGLQPGDEVLVPTYTFTATAEIITYLGGRPVLCDSVEGGFNIDAMDAARRITPKTKAIIPVHIAGEPCDMAAIHQLAQDAGMQVIEDAAHALPTTYKGKRIGTHSALIAFSFYATKNITTGEGGMLVTDDDGYAERARRLRLHGINGEAWKRYSREGSWYYEVADAGFKMNMPDILAALGSAQLSKCDKFFQRRQEIAERYCERFAQIEEVELPPACEPGDQHSWHLFILRLRRNANVVERNDLVEQLKTRGIGTSVHYIPLHLHPFYAQTYGYRPGDFPHAEDAYSRAISLPIYPDLSDADVERVIEAVEQVVTARRCSTMAARG